MTGPGSRVYRHVTLDPNVLLVAIETVGVDWAAYIGAVPGISHEAEYMSVADSGTKVTEEMGKLFFGSIARRLPWRD